MARETDKGASLKGTIVPGHVAGATYFLEPRRRAELAIDGIQSRRARRPTETGGRWRYVAGHNIDPTPFRWKADPDKIIAAASRGHQTLDSIH